MTNTSDARRRAKWNPKRLGVQQSSNCAGLSTEVWCYLEGSPKRPCLSIHIQVNKDGVVMGHVSYDLRLPRGR